MTIAMKYTGNIINRREHQQAITANLIHSLDAYHLRRVIKICKESNIPLFTLHDCIIVDILYIRGMKYIIREEFNIIYADPEGILKSIYESIRNSNPGMEEDSEIEEKIKLLMGKGKIKASKDLFHY